MKAHDVMTAEIVAAPPTMPVRQIARLLLDKGISAVPVLDEAGAPLGMVSDGDLVGRTEEERAARKDWWLALAAEPGKPKDGPAALPAERLARDVMVGPVVTVGEDADVSEVARLLGANRIKRVPVLRNGRVVGIVSRSDLLRALAAERPKEARAQGHESAFGAALASLDAPFRHHDQTPPAATLAAEVKAPNASAADFRGLMSQFDAKLTAGRTEARTAAREHEKREVAELAREHISDEAWRQLVAEARTAAAQGQKEFMLLRFPSQLCSDGGRAINAPEPNWPTTLRGEAAELYLRWERELRPQGFHLVARVLDFPGGIPGDIGLLISWGA